MVSVSAPLIIVVGRFSPEAKNVRGEAFALGQRYMLAIERAGGIPLMLPPIPALAGERTSDERREARALRDLRGLGVALLQDEAALQRRGVAEHGGDSREEPIEDKQLPSSRQVGAARSCLQPTSSGALRMADSGARHPTV